MKPEVIVVGAGIPGLTAAHYLNRAGYDVVVLEQQDTPGGRMRQVEIEGVQINTGARLLYTFYSVVMELIKELNLESEMEYLGTSELLCDDGHRRYPVSFSPGPSLLMNPVLTKSTRLRLMNIIPDLVKARFATDPDHMTTCEFADKESLEDYLSRKVGTDFVQKIVNPLFRGARSWNANEVSPAFFLTTGAHMPGHRPFTFRQGIGYLAEKLAAKLKIRYGVSVKSIQRNLNMPGAVVEFLDSGTDDKLDADIVVCATEGAKVRDLIINKNEAEKRFATKIKYNSLGIVYFVLKHVPKHSVTFYTQDHPSPLAILESVTGENNKPHLFCELTPETLIEVAHMQGQDTMDKLIMDDARKRYPLLAENLDYSVNQWIEHMLPVFYPGYISSLKQFIEHQDTAPQSIYYCGDYLSQALVGGACASGKDAAMTIINHWSKDRANA